LYPDPADALNVGSLSGRILPANPLSLPASPPGVTGIFGAQKHIAVAALETRRGLDGDEPPAAEKEARPERRHKYRAALFWFTGARKLQNRIKCHAARGRAEIPEGLGHGGEFMLGQTQLLGKESDQTGVGLMRRQSLHGSPSDTAAEFNVRDHSLQPGDGRAGESFAVKVHVEISVECRRHANRSSILTGAAEEKFSEAVRVLRVGLCGTSQEKRCGAVTEQTAELSGDATRGEDAAVNVGGDHCDGAGSS
jgi:hypothetical protein